MQELIEVIQNTIRQEISDKFETLNNSINELSKKTDTRFDAITEKLIEHDKKFENYDKRFENYDKRFENYDKRFENYDKRFENYDKKFENYDKKFDNHDKKFENYDKRFDNLETEIKYIKDLLFIIEHEHGKKIDAIYDLVNLDREINKPKFDEISKVSKKSEQNYLHILNHEDRISTLEKNNS